MNINVLSPSQENTLSFLPQAIGKKVKKALEEYGLPLRYNRYLSNFSKKGAEFATFGQIKVLLEEVNFTLHWDDSDEPDWEWLFEQLDLTQDEKAELQARNQARIENFATAVQEESFAPRDLRVLRKATQKAEQTTSQEVEQNAEQKDAFPLLSQALAEKKITPLQYKQLMIYLGKVLEFSKYGKELQSIIKSCKFEDLILFFQDGVTKELIQIMKEKQNWELIKIMETGQTDELIDLLSEFDFQEAKEKYWNDPKFQKELLTTMKIPRRKKSWRKF